MLTWTARKLSTCSFRPSKHVKLLYFAYSDSKKPYKDLPKPSQNPNTIFTSSLRFSSSSSSSSNSPILKETTNNGAVGGSSLSCLCPGCGVSMQDTDPKLPGFFTKPSPKNPSYEPKKPVVCARCHSLRHYGKVKCAEVERLLPSFDFDRTVGRRLASASGSRSVVMMVVDSTDFDGSFPRRVVRSLLGSIQEHRMDWTEGKPGNVPRVVMVASKIDLLPTEALSPTGMEHWVRRRAREAAADGEISAVHLVSSLKNWGIKNLLNELVELVGARGHVYVVGAQNAGKSTLINSLGKVSGGKVVSELTEAVVPGTTLGIVRVDGVLPGQAKLFDTPGILHPHQLMMRLTSEEQKLVRIDKELKPRTYRVGAGHSVHIAGLMRLDVEEASVDSIYLTIWASPHLPLHMGKTENACTMIETHFGRQLKPPNSQKRVEELGKWVRKECTVSGNSWKVSSVDVAAAGLGWFAVGLKGMVRLGVWTYEGVDVVLRDSLLPHRARRFEETGFTVSKVVSQADKALNQLQLHQVEKKKSECEKLLSATI
ncbi:hypothetical protein QJS04_geneDACA024220 [Acorus gramineus]|uniref:G domain-containing protein n=1 Tax=Acorus gramineus TaxID=55184 RepID=A0AAV9A1H5_ACOGR|nr:hypothetical protein QJS04_geneDACA024220 [Acorus gramineus]